MTDAQSVQSNKTVPSPAASPVDVGRLKGLTILRFAHASGEGGGLERYLLDLNRALGARNQFTSVQVELSYDRQQFAEQTKVYEGCRLVKVPLFAEREQHNADAVEHKSGGPDEMKSWLVNKVLCAPPVYQGFTRHWLKHRRVPRRPGEAEGAGTKVAELIKRLGVDLIVLHSSGGADASEIIEAAKAGQVPVAMVHHFANDRLAGLSLRQQISRVAGVGGVCGVAVPAYLQKRYVNLSDGINTEFYQPANVRTLSRNNANPVLFLPARITPTKGQADLLRVAAELKKRGVCSTVVFAGRVDSPAFEAELHAMAKREELAENVEFVGQLGPEQLRDWYAAARILVFPTYHHEGLPRILMECQAMGLPPVVYDIGGTSEGLLDRKSGFLIPLGDVQQMTNAVESLLKDDSLRATMSQAGRRFVEERFSLRSLAERHEDFYLKVLSAHRNGMAAH